MGKGFSVHFIQCLETSFKRDNCSSNRFTMYYVLYTIHSSWDSDSRGQVKHVFLIMYCKGASLHPVSRGTTEPATSYQQPDTNQQFRYQYRFLLCHCWLLVRYLVGTESKLPVKPASCWQQFRLTCGFLIHLPRQVFKG